MSFPCLSSCSATSTLTLTPLAIFFASFKGFSYNPYSNAADEFQRLQVHQQWGRKNKKLKCERGCFHTAFEEEFNIVFGGTVGDRWDWRYLCLVLGVDPPPPSKTQARKALQGIRVNIYDILHYEKFFRRGGDPEAVLVTFDSIKKLAAYSRDQEKVFPKKVAKEMGAVRCVLRPLRRNW